MGIDTSISRLSFAEAQSSGAEAMLGIAQHRNETLQSENDGVTDAVKSAQFDDRTATAKTHAHHAVDKTA
jgi:hypothetical protein